MGDLNDEFSNQRRELEQTQEMLLKELRLKQVIINNFIPHEFKRQMTHRLNYDEDEGKWFLSASHNLPALPKTCSSKSEIRPTSDFEKVARMAEEPLHLGRYKVIIPFMITNRLLLLLEKNDVSLQYPRKVHEKNFTSYWNGVKNGKLKSVYLLNGWSYNFFVNG